MPPVNILLGETLWVHPLFLALSVATGGWDDNVVGLTLLSALFSVLELVTELQYYVTEADYGNLLALTGVRIPFPGCKSLSQGERREEPGDRVEKD